MLKTNAKSLKFIVFVLLFCLLIASVTVFCTVSSHTALADEGEQTQPAAEPNAEPQAEGYKLYIVLGIAGVLLAIVIVVVVIANKKYILAFIVGKRAQPIPPRKYLAGEELDTLPVPMRNGARFGGWYADPYLKEPFKTATMPKKDTFVFAKWKRRPRWYYKDEAQINAIKKR